MAGPFEAPLEILFLALLLSSKLDFDSPKNFLIHPGLIYRQHIGQEAFLTSFSGRMRVNGRLGSAILNSPTRARLLCGLLLLCGDVSLNPGPVWKHPCGICTKPVKSNQRGLQCDLCLWLCPKCDASNFSETLLSASTLELSNSFEFLPIQTSSPVAKTTPRNSCTGAVLEHARKSSRPRHQGLKVYNINFQSLKNKSCEFQAFLETESPDIVIGTETWLNSSVKTCEFFPANYSVFRRDRLDGYGGVLVAVKDLSCQELDELNSDCETVWIKVSVSSRKHVYIGAFYNPDSSCEALDELDRSLSKLQRKSGNSVIYLGGDFNLGGDICWETNTIARGSRHVTACEKLLEMCCTYSLEQVVDKPTRGDKILDLLFTTNSTLVDSVEVKPAMGDHGCVEMQTLVSPKLARPIRRKIFLYSKGNFDDMKKDLLEFGSVYLTNFTDRSLQDNWDMLKGKLSSLMEEYIPTKMSSSRYNLPWFTHNLKKLNRKIQRLYNVQRRTGLESDKRKFRQTRKAYRHKLNQSYGDYINNLLVSPQREQPKKFWRFVKSKRQDNMGINLLHNQRNIAVSNSLDKANILNDYFFSIFTKEDSSTAPSLDPKSSSPAMGKIIVTPNGVQKLLDSLNSNKAGGPDKLPTRILKILSQELAPLYTQLFQQSLDQGKLPMDWKIANVVPIFKKGKRSSPNNYRPVSLTSVTCKILEHVICHHVWQHLEKHGILSDFQHGFRKRKNCETQLIITCHDLVSAVNQGKRVDAFILDFSKAFDRVPHGRLLYKLSYYGIRGSLLTWMEDFLTQRSQCVTPEGATSSQCSVTSGVPQGTVLGPLLFLLFVNDLPLNISSTIRLFADDCLLYRTIDSPNDSLALQNDLDALSRWERDWQMAFNVEKCHTMCFSTSRAKIPDHPYTLKNQFLERVHHHSYLGVLLSGDLKWDKHIAQISSSANQTLGVIRRNFKTASVDCKSKLYCSLVRPKLEYANSAWYPHLQKDKHRLDMVQRSAARVCYNNYLREPGVVTNMLRELEWPSLEGRRTLSRMSMFHQVVYGTVDIEREPFLVPMDRPSRNGNSKRFHRTHSNCNQHANSFFPWSIKFWNNLPGSITDIKEKGKFKGELQQYLIDNGQWF